MVPSVAQAGAGPAARVVTAVANIHAAAEELQLKLLYPVPDVITLDAGVHL